MNGRYPGLELGVFLREVLRYRSKEQGSPRLFLVLPLSIKCS